METKTINSENAYSSEFVEEARKYVCESCGERCEPFSGHWRFHDGEWFHNHGVFMEYYTAKREEE